MGAITDQSGVLLYPTDTKGALKFLIADDYNSGPAGTVNLYWQDRIWLQAKQTFELPYARSQDRSNATVKKITDEYGKWGRQRWWFKSMKRKLAACYKELENGIIKFTAFEAIGKMVISGLQLKKRKTEGFNL